jgi:hypothetical protein
VNRRGLRFGTFASGLAALVLAVAACSSAGPTSIIIHITLPPASIAPAGPTGAQTEQPTEAATQKPVATPKPSPTVKPSPTPVPTPGPTDTPFVSFTLPPAGTPVPSTACTGSASNQAFFASAAKQFSWSVYCAVLPTGWFLTAGDFHGNQLTATYKGPGGAIVNLKEGGFCTTSAAVCTPRDHPLGTAMFSDQVGGLVALGPTAAGGFAIYVSGGTAHAYEINSTGPTQAKFVAYAAALVKVAKS